MISQTLDAIAEKAIFVEIDDLPALGELHSLLEELHKDFKQVGNSASLQGIDQDLALLVNIMLSDSKNPKQDLDAIKAHIFKLQNEQQKSGKADRTASVESLPHAKASHQAPLENDPIVLFLESSRDKLRQIEELALAIEKESSSDQTDQALGLIHTLKGESGVLGFSEINEVCHKLESIIQEGALENIPNRMLDFCDWLMNQLENIENGSALDVGNEDILKRLTALEGPVADQDRGAVPTTPNKKANATDSTTVASTHKPASATTATPVNPASAATPITQDPSFYTDFAQEAREHIESAEQILLEINPSEGEVPVESINTIFRSFHTIKGVSGFLDLADLQLITHRAENVFDQIRSQKLSMTSEIHDLCFKVLDKVKELVKVMESCAIAKNPIPRDESISIYVELLDGVISGDHVPANLSLNPGGTQGPKLAEAHDAPEAKSGGEAKANAEVNTIKVNTDRLDKVINLVGELVISHSMICEELNSNLSKTLLTNMSHMKKNVNELQSLAMALRMVPIKNTFLKMSRIIRDLSKKMGKNIEFTMEGEDTELDRNMVDQLGDPLVHMVRNSADHGVESPDKRLAAGKPAAGKVCLRAFHKGGNIVIQIADDGKGIDKEVILKKAIEKGMVQKNQDLSEQEIFQLIFAAGFSTAEKVTDVSGRGVGMDVVRRNIESLRGRIEISSEKGKGSTFSILLPLTLAIIDGMIVRVGSDRFIIPTINIDQTSGIKDEGIFTVQNQGKMIKFRNKMVPLIQLDQIFNDPYYHCNGGILIVLVTGEKNIAIIVDEIITQQEVVIKSLGESMKNIKGLAGSAILPDGNVGIILDPLEITEMIRKNP